jgi:hypothetical protein
MIYPKQKSEQPKGGEEGGRRGRGKEREREKEREEMNGSLEFQDIWRHTEIQFNTFNDTIVCKHTYRTNVSPCTGEREK